MQCCNPRTDFAVAHGNPPSLDGSRPRKSDSPVLRITVCRASQRSVGAPLISEVHPWIQGRTTVKTILATLIALSVLAGVAGSASAADPMRGVWGHFSTGQGS